MTMRYGEKTRGTAALTDFGKAPSGTTAKTFYEDQFLAPGTWTKPANATFVEVTVVGGGGGGKSGVLLPTGLGGERAGGGGGVRVAWTPVSGPVPVTVGAGGAAGTIPSPDGQPGGVSAFGPLGPGPVPLIPALTIAAGGGGGGINGGTPLPAIGGGGGGGGNIGGGLGFPSTSNAQKSNAGGGAGSSGGGDMAGLDLYGFGAGGGSNFNANAQNSHNAFDCAVHTGGGIGADDFSTFPQYVAAPGRANSGGGGGGGGYAPPTYPVPQQPKMVGGSGGSGIVIVRYLA